MLPISKRGNYVSFWSSSTAKMKWIWNYKLTSVVIVCLCVKYLNITIWFLTLTTSFIYVADWRVAQQPRGNCGRGWQSVRILGTLSGYQPWNSTGIASTGKGVFQAVLRQKQWGEDAICKQILTRQSASSPRRLRKQVGVQRWHRLELARLLWASHASNLTQKPATLASWTRILQVTQSFSIQAKLSLIQ